MAPRNKSGRTAVSAAAKSRREPAKRHVTLPPKESIIETDPNDGDSPRRVVLGNGDKPTVVMRRVGPCCVEIDLADGWVHSFMSLEPVRWVAEKPATGEKKPPR